MISKRTREGNEVNGQNEITQVQPGDTIRFFYGPMYGEEIGTAEGHEIDRWGAHLRVTMADGRTEWVDSLTTTGIGAYWTPRS